MRFNYVVTLKRGNENQIDRIGLILCIIAILAFASAQLKSGQFSILLSSGILFTILLILLDRPKSDGKRVRRFRNALFVAGMFWWAMPVMQWLSLLYFAAAFLESLAKRPLEIGFADQEVTVNGFPRRTYQWREFNNVVLKDGLLTIDFKNNRIIQRETIEDEEDDATEDEFNDYCHGRLTASAETA